ncbi:MAG: hypothetical protein R2690_09420 [Acidimicrobiales bacterium]
MKIDGAAIVVHVEVVVVSRYHVDMDASSAKAGTARRRWTRRAQQRERRRLVERDDDDVRAIGRLGRRDHVEARREHDPSDWRGTGNDTGNSTGATRRWRSHNRTPAFVVAK